MSRKPPLSRRPPIGGGATIGHFSGPISSDKIKYLAQKFELNEAALSENMERCRTSWISDELRRSDASNRNVMDFVAKAKGLFEVWDSLSISIQASLFVHARHYEADMVQFNRGLTYLAQVGEMVVRSWPEMDSQKRAWPRQNLTEILKDFWKAEKGSPASAGTPPGGSSTETNLGGEFVSEAVGLITGTALTADKVREANPARRARKGKKRTNKPGSSP